MDCVDCDHCDHLRDMITCESYPMYRDFETHTPSPSYAPFRVEGSLTTPATNQPAITPPCPESLEILQYSNKLAFFCFPHIPASPERVGSTLQFQFPVSVPSPSTRSSPVETFSKVVVLRSTVLHTIFSQTSTALQHGAAQSLPPHHQSELSLGCLGCLDVATLSG